MAQDSCRYPKVIRAAAGDEDLDSDKDPEPYAKIVSAESDSDESNDIASQDKVSGGDPLFPSSTERIDSSFLLVSHQ